MAHYYYDHGFRDEVYVADSSDSTGWAVGMLWDKIPSHCNFADAIVHIETCCSEFSGAWTGARVEFVTKCGIQSPESATNIYGIWAGLDGEYGWKYRTACWAKQNATTKCDMRERQTNGGHTTLAPCVKWTNVTPFQLLPPNGMDVGVLFDTKVNCAGDPLQVWRADGGAFTLSNAEWMSDTSLVVTVSPAGNTGTGLTGTLVVQHDRVASAANACANLDGDARAGASD